MTDSFRVLPAIAIGTCLVAVACAKGDPGGAPMGAASAAASPGGSAAAPSAATCTADPEKVWGDGASVLAGVTETDFDGRMAFGVFRDGQPEVLLFDDKGQAEEKRLPAKKALTDVLAKDKARREVRRVTPASTDKGDVFAYVDYVIVQEGHRVVACGRGDASDENLKFDGKPLVAVNEDRVTEAPSRPEKAAAAPSAATPHPPAEVASAGSVPPPRMIRVQDVGDRLRALRSRQMQVMEKAQGASVPHPAPAAASAVPSPPHAVASAAPPVAKAGAAGAKPKGDKVVELRDCRTLVDRGGARAFTVGSELVGQPLDDGSTDYTMEFFVADEKGHGKSMLTVSSLGKKPETLPDFDAPVAWDFGTGERALTARHRGSVFAWLLDTSRHPRGPLRSFPLASPGVPHFSAFGPETALLVASRERGRSAAESLVFEQGVSQLPASLTELHLADLSLVGSLTGVMSGTSRFLAVQADETARRLVVVPVDAALSASGPPAVIDAPVFESRIAKLADGRLLVVYLRSADNRVELVSRTVHCG